MQINAETFLKYEKIKIEECYSVTVMATPTDQYNTTSYTLFRSDRCRDTAIRKFIDHCSQNRGMSMPDGWAFDGFSGANESLYHHPGFLCVVRNSGIMGKSPSSSFVSWMKDLQRRDGGMLKKFHAWKSASAWRWVTTPF